MTSTSGVKYQPSGQVPDSSKNSDEMRSGREDFRECGYTGKRILGPVLDLLRQGVTPGKIAISVSLGLALGVFPVVGSTTLLCTLAAVALGLNLPAIQLVNFLASPLQLALLVPFMQIGAQLFGSDPTAISLPQVLLLVRSDLRLAVATLWSARFTPSAPGFA